MDTASAETVPRRQHRLHRDRCRAAHPGGTRVPRWHLSRRPGRARRPPGRRRDRRRRPRAVRSDRLVRRKGRPAGNARGAPDCRGTDLPGRGRTSAYPAERVVSQCLARERASYRARRPALRLCSDLVLCPTSIPSGPGRGAGRGRPEGYRRAGARSARRVGWCATGVRRALRRWSARHDLRRARRARGLCELSLASTGGGPSRRGHAERQRGRDLRAAAPGCAGGRDPHRRGAARGPGLPLE